MKIVKRILPAWLQNFLKKLISTIWSPTYKTYRKAKYMGEIVVKSTPFISHYFRPWPVPNKVTLMVTYRCSLSCTNCNSNCSQVPSGSALSIDQIKKFISESIETNIRWGAIVLSGGEPTIHKDFHEIIRLLMEYRTQYSNRTMIRVLTNNYTKATKEALALLPPEVQIQRDTKSSSRNRFHPINLAPKDHLLYRFANYSLGCEGVTNCGIALSQTGYYPCPYHPGFDRILHLGLGKMTVKELKETFLETNKTLCSYCGAWRIARSTYKFKASRTWKNAFRDYEKGGLPELKYF